MTWLVVIGAMAAALWFYQGRLNTGVEWAKDQISRAAVVPDKVDASTAAKGHPRKLTIDGKSNTYWAPESSDGSGEWLEYHFTDPIRVVRITMVPGAAKDDEAAFRAEARPSVVMVSLATSDGRTVEKQWSMPDEKGAKAIDVGIDDVTDVRLTILGAEGTGEGRLVAVSEVEFTTRG